MRKITVIGSPGSGKSVFSRKLGERLGLPVIHLDRHYWQDGWTPTPNDEWDEFLKETTRGEEWIIDGNYTRTLDIRIQASDTVIFLDLPRLLCVYRVFKRRLIYRGKTRPDLQENCPEKLDAEFVAWVWNYNKHSRPLVMEALQREPAGRDIVMLRSSREIEDFLRKA